MVINYGEGRGSYTTVGGRSSIPTKKMGGGGEKSFSHPEGGGGAKHVLG